MGLKAKIRREEGSISVLVFGLFAVVLLSSVVLTDIASIIIAHRSLVQATESAAQSAAHALDLDTYYQGKHSALSFLVSDSSPVIPIDCGAAKSRATETLNEISSTSANLSSAFGSNSKSSRQDDSSYSSHSSNSRNSSNSSDQELLRPELSEIQISEFQCNGTQILITTSAKAWLPISLSLFSFESVNLSASAGTTSVKKRVLSLFGIL